MLWTVDELHTKRDMAFQEQADAIFLAEEKTEEVRSAHESLADKGLLHSPLVR
jgi:hypothetical protein